MLIYKVETQDVYPLLALSKQTFADAFEKVSNPENYQKYVKKTFTLASFEAQILEPQAAFYILEYEGNPAAYLKIRWDRPSEEFGAEKSLEIERIYVLKQYWSQKLGAKLMEYALQYAQDNGYDLIWLLVWHENDQAIKFYERWGFEKHSRKEFLFGEEIHLDWVMVKKINA